MGLQEGKKMYSKSYYGNSGVRELCHAVKGRKKNIPIRIMAEFLEQFVDDHSIIIPAPQHYGYADYTLEIAQLICKAKGSRVADILKCIPHDSLYQQKLKGNELNLELLLNGAAPSYGKLFFLDNVISTGTTYKAAQSLLGRELIPLVYAIDERRYKS